MKLMAHGKTHFTFRVSSSWYLEWRSRFQLLAKSLAIAGFVSGIITKIISRILLFRCTSQRPSWRNFNKGFLISIFCPFLQPGRHSIQGIFLAEWNSNIITLHRHHYRSYSPTKLHHIEQSFACWKIIKHGRFWLKGYMGRTKIKPM